ncbi:helix-turn-helix domain-containing protein [Hymenobacter algoricola]|uniref:DNA binding HTH domain-containing protein n=1 Tax=Hymenobacter algoricola TaxID=486267 RepID=A0ABP7N3L1_9BACT
MNCSPSTICSPTRYCLDRPTPTAGTPGFTLRTAGLRHMRPGLAEAHGNKAEAARMLNVAVTTLSRKMQEYGLKE